MTKNENCRFHKIIPQGKGDLRSEYARDRDRILYAPCFRRLAHKTQVYITTNKDYPLNEHTRTRLTHTLEVLSVAKSIGESLNKHFKGEPILNMELIEAITYGHDVGHAPFGHAGEHQLDLFISGKNPLPRAIENMFEDGHEEMRAHGDFRHNFQGVRQLSLISKYTPNENGLNLTRKTLYGILMHTGLNSKATGKVCRYFDYSDIREKTENDKCFKTLLAKGIDVESIESRIVGLADEIAQITHDLEDSFSTQLIPYEKIIAEMFGSKNHSILKSIKKSKKIKSNFEEPEVRIQLQSGICSYMITSIVSILKKAITPNDILKSVKEIDRYNFFSPPSENFASAKILKMLYKIKIFKDNFVINNYIVNRMDNKGEYIIRKLTEAYISDPRQLPDSALQRYLDIKKSRFKRICDYSLHDNEISKSLNRTFKSYIFYVDKLSLKKEFRLNRKEIHQILKTVKVGKSSGLRNLKHEFITKLIPIMVYDKDFTRCICDCIAQMTDSYAIKEVNLLYGK